MSGVRIAIAGNPNAGKTSIFNHLTGAVQQVSNYPGVTVERKAGRVRYGDQRYTVLDLPGTYSLTAYSQEEIIARQAIIDEKPDLVVNVVDASNLERNLYLTTQIMEMQVPLVIALNMADMARRRGFEINAPELSRRLGVPIVPTIGSKGKGIDELLAVCAEVVGGQRPATPRGVTYGHEVDAVIDDLAALIAREDAVTRKYYPRWVAVKLVEKDPQVAERLREIAGDRWPILETAANQAIREIERHFNEDAATIIAERRYGFAAGAVRECVSLTGEARQNMTERIDQVACDRVFGPIILVGVVAALFLWVFKLSDEWAWIPLPTGWTSPTGLMGACFDALSRAVAPLETQAPMLHSLLDDGIIGGVGGVMRFVPLIFFLFMFISALEDTGYVARVAFILDRLLQTFGLQGKSILALLVSGGLGAGGCAVPGVMATRTLREEKDRLVTMLVTPFMSCGAKLPVYAMLIAAFFSEHRTEMMLLLWAISWVVALCAAWTLRRFVIRGEQTPFVMELPPYHMPVLRGVLQHTWERTWMYIKKAGTIILAMNIVLWSLMYFPRLPQPAAEGSAAAQHQFSADQLAHSVAGRVGKALEPVSRFAGFDWQVNIALIGGFAAKELVIGTLGTVYSMEQLGDQPADSLPARLASDPAWNPLRAFALMIFVMLYAPCFVTVAVIRRESGSWKWAAFSTLYSTGIAMVLAVIIFQVGRLAGLGV